MAEGTAKRNNGEPKNPMSNNALKLTVLAGDIGGTKTEAGRRKWTPKSG